MSRRAKKQKPGDLFVRQTLEEQLLWQLRTDLMAGVPRAALIERIDDMLHRPGVRKTRMWRPLSVPEHGSPQLRFIYEEANRAMMTLTHLARSAGIGVDTLKYWRRRDREPTLGNVEACMNALGYTLTPARKR